MSRTASPVNAKGSPAVSCSRTNAVRSCSSPTNLTVGYWRVTDEETVSEKE